MLLYEFDNTTPLRTKLIAVTAQLHSIVEKNSKKKNWKPWSKSKLQNYLTKNDIILDDEDLFDLVKKSPLNKVISNINDDEVTFVGVDGDHSMPQTEKTKKDKKDTVASMASKAQSKSN